MEHVFNHEELPSGKTIFRHFGESGLLVQETHGYGTLDIAINYDFEAGIKVRETYFVKRRMVSCRTYEKARTAYTDMPVADATVEDIGAQMLRAASSERRRQSLKPKQHAPDPDEARTLDSFCSMIMDKGRTEDAVQWIQTKSHTLGERDWRGSKRLVDRLSALGCVSIYACEVDVYEAGAENTGHLVIELPVETAKRSKVLKTIDRLASEQGYSGPADDGQRYAYVKLD